MTPLLATISSHDSFRKPRFELRPALAMVVEKRFVVCAHLDDALGDAGEQRQVAADVRLHVQAGDLGAEQQAPDVARHAEVAPGPFRRSG